MEIPEGVVRHDRLLVCLADIRVTGKCHCGAEQRARDDGAKWAEHFAEVLGDPPSDRFSAGHCAGFDNAKAHLLMLAEQLRAGEQQ